MHIEKTKNTPFIHISNEECIFEIKGKSYSLGLRDFYAPVLSWIENEMHKITCDIKCPFYITMINSESLLIFSEIIFKMNSHFKNGMNIKIDWVYEEDDEDMYETGMLLSELTQIPFKFVMSND